MSRLGQNRSSANAKVIWGRNIATRAPGRPPPEYYWDAGRWCYTGGQHGDGREQAASEFARKRVSKGNPAAFLGAIDSFHGMGRDHELIHVGPKKGAWLAAAVQARRPLKILEFGTQIGYSTILMARVLPPGGCLWTIEPNPDNAALATANIEYVGLHTRVKVLHGTFDDVWKVVPCPMDLIFLDHSRAAYLRELVNLERWGYVIDGTVVVADNIGGQGGSHGHAKVEEYAKHVRQTGKYSSIFISGDDDGIEVSEFVGQNEHARYITPHWGTVSAATPFQGANQELQEKHQKKDPCKTGEALTSRNGLPSAAGDDQIGFHQDLSNLGRRWGRTQEARTLVLWNGLSLPLLGFGTWNLRGPCCNMPVQTAIKHGYGLIDTSSAYGNEADIGRVLGMSSVGARPLIQTKIGPRDMGYENTRTAAEKSIRHLVHVDVLLIHWPGRSRNQRFETWRALEELYTEKKVRAIGVSNFLPEHIRELFEDGAKIKPLLNQVEIHLLCQGRDIVNYCRTEGIALQSYSTLGGGPQQGKIRREDGTATLLGHSVIKSVATEIGQCPALVCLRWAVQQGMAVIPKSSSPEHIANNAKVFDFKLSPEQMARLARLDQDHHFAWNPKEILTNTN